MTSRSRGSNGSRTGNRGLNVTGSGSNSNGITANFRRTRILGTLDKSIVRFGLVGAITLIIRSTSHNRTRAHQRLRDFAGSTCSSNRGALSCALSAFSGSDASVAPEGSAVNDGNLVTALVQFGSRIDLIRPVFTIRIARIIDIISNRTLRDRNISTTAIGRCKGSHDLHHLKDAVGTYIVGDRHGENFGSSVSIQVHFHIQNVLVKISLRRGGKVFAIGNGDAIPATVIYSLCNLNLDSAPSDK